MSDPQTKFQKSFPDGTSCSYEGKGSADIEFGVCTILAMTAAPPAAPMPPMERTTIAPEKMIFSMAL